MGERLRQGYQRAKHIAPHQMLSRKSCVTMCHSEDLQVQAISQEINIKQNPSNFALCKFSIGQKREPEAIGLMAANDKGLRF